MIAVLISTYNGEKYLAQQLDSLLNQSFKDYTIHIRDDGSIDKTVDILKLYKSKYPTINLYIDSGHGNKGPSFSFMWLLKNVEADYYMFCDQDDIWFSNKIQISFDAIRSEEVRTKNTPILVHTDLIITDSKLNFISKSLWENDAISPFYITRKHLRLVNYVTGCTILINRKVKEIAFLDFNNQIMHDHWIAICVESSDGIIISLPIPTIFYRQHGDNVIGSNVSNIKISALNRYFHLPNFEYSRTLFRVMRLKYNMNFIRYIFYRLYFYFSH